MDQAEMIQILSQEVRGLSNYLVSDDYENALRDAGMETGWALPLGESDKLYWLKSRAKRHLYEYMRTESAHKFKYEQINLQHRFDHYHILVGEMDKAFTTFKLENPELFISDDLKVHLFGTSSSAGFSYDRVGRDTTYNPLNIVTIRPTK